MLPKIVFLGGMLLFLSYGCGAAELPTLSALPILSDESAVEKRMPVLARGAEYSDSQYSYGLRYMDYRSSVHVYIAEAPIAWCLQYGIIERSYLFWPERHFNNTLIKTWDFIYAKNVSGRFTFSADNNNVLRLAFSGKGTCEIKEKTILTIAMEMSGLYCTNHENHEKYMIDENALMMLYDSISGKFAIYDTNGQLNTVDFSLKQDDLSVMFCGQELGPFGAKHLWSSAQPLMKIEEFLQDNVPSFMGYKRHFLFKERKLIICDVNEVSAHKNICVTHDISAGSSCVVRSEKLLYIRGAPVKKMYDFKVPWCTPVGTIQLGGEEKTWDISFTQTSEQSDVIMRCGDQECIYSMLGGAARPAQPSAYLLLGSDSVHVNLLLDNGLIRWLYADSWLRMSVELDMTECQVIRSISYPLGVCRARTNKKEHCLEGRPDMIDRFPIQYHIDALAGENVSYYKQYKMLQYLCDEVQISLWCTSIASNQIDLTFQALRGGRMWAEQAITVQRRGPIICCLSDNILQRSYPLCVSNFVVHASLRGLCDGEYKLYLDKFPIIGIVLIVRGRSAEERAVGWECVARQPQVTHSSKRFLTLGKKVFYTVSSS